MPSNKISYSLPGPASTDGVLALVSANLTQLWRDANRRQISTYWKIGALFAKYDQQDLQTNQRDLSKQMEGGSPFLADVDVMVDLSRKLTIDQAEIMAAKIDWAFFEVILKRETAKECFFYAWLCAEYQLSIDELSYRIAEDTFNKALQHPNKLGSLMGLQDKRLPKKLIPVLEDETGLAMLNSAAANILKPYAEYISDTDRDMEEETASFRNELYVELRQIVAKHIRQEAVATNYALNKLFWNIGRNLIKNELDTDNESVSLIDTAAALAKKYGPYFNVENLTTMKAFAEQFPAENLAFQMAYLIGWYYIVALLKLEDTNAQLFYATLSANEELILEKLQEKIESDIYTKTGNKGRISALIPETKKIVSFEGHNTVTIREIKLGLSSGNGDIISTDIFKTSYFKNIVSFEISKLP